MVRTAFIGILLGLALLFAGIVPTLVRRPEHFYPVRYYRAHLDVNASSVTSIRPGEPPKTYSIEPAPEGSSDTFELDAEVRVERPVRVRPGAPTDQDLARAGPEQAVVVSLMGHRRSRDDANPDFSLYVWPPEPTDRKLPFAFVTLPTATVTAALSALAEETLYQSSDRAVADAVRVGGKVAPELPYLRRGAAKYERTLFIAGAAPLMVNMVAMRMRNWRLEKPDHRGGA